MKNRTKRIDSQVWQRKLDNKVFAVSPHFTSFKDPKGWLVELMNWVSRCGVLLGRCGHRTQWVGSLYLGVVTVVSVGVVLDGWGHYTQVWSP